MVLADQAAIDAQNLAGDKLKRYAPSSGSYMANMRELGLKSAKNRADIRQRIKSEATKFNLTTEAGINTQNAGIAMQESIARQQELDAARENITEGLDILGNRANMGYRDFKIDQVNKTIANNIGTNDWKFDPINKTITFRNKDGNVVTVPAESVTTPNVGTGKT
jgi:hypothetical protein